MDVNSHNSIVWDNPPSDIVKWSLPVSEKIIKLAREYKTSVLLTNTKPVPMSWYMPVEEKDTMPCKWWRTTSSDICCNEC